MSNWIGEMIPEIVELMIEVSGGGPEVVVVVVVVAVSFAVLVFFLHTVELDFCTRCLEVGSHG